VTVTPALAILMIEQYTKMILSTVNGHDNNISQQCNKTDYRPSACICMQSAILFYQIYLSSVGIVSKWMDISSRVFDLSSGSDSILVFFEIQHRYKIPRTTPSARGWNTRVRENFANTAIYVNKKLSCRWQTAQRV